MIAVLTWKLYNFGTALQAFSLVKFIEKNNEKNGGCKILNYSLPERKKIIRVNNLTIRDWCNKINNRITIWGKEKKNQKIKERYLKEIYLQQEKFKRFYDLIPHDNHEVHITESAYFNSVYDKIIVGSDQVWNPKYFCETYFLDFIDDSKKYTYAPSLGVGYLTAKEKEFLKNRLENHFQRLSVRERTGVNLLKTILPDNDIVNVLDPTLLFTGKQWKSMFDLNSKEEEKYILVYTLSDNLWYKNAINQLVKETKIKKVKYITPEDNLYFYADQNDLIVETGPIEFLKLIYNAQFVITDSFHGVCFSLNFEKQFICLSRFKENNKKNENSRIKDLLEQLDMYEKVFFKSSKISISVIDYDEINKRMDILRKQSERYLLEIIKNNV